MEKKNYIIVSTIVTDDVTQADGTYSGHFLGGAGIYALAGIRLWTKDAVIVTGIGEDFDDSYRAWFRRNDCPQEGLLIKDAHTAISNVVYQEDGERMETPEYGKGHYWKLEAKVEELESFFEEAKGVYIFKDLQKEFWEKVIASRKKYGFFLMWELNEEITVPESIEDVRRLAEHCDLISLNRTEAQRLFGEENLNSVIDKLLTWNVPMVYLRAGGKGAFVISGGKVCQIPTEENVNVVDVTGAGNSSTAAVLYGYCEGASSEACGIMGSISAARCIEQYGPPDLTDEKMQQAQEILKYMLRKHENSSSKEQRKV